jgi:site-specific DNA recombinase
MTASSKLVRCAIYTRVSTDAGLDQEFNSLDAQYDASEAYIRSQAHAGWALTRLATTMAGSREGQPTDLPFKSFWPISKPAKLMSSLSIRSIG